MKKMIPINFHTTFGQNTIFHMLGKKVENSYFFPFFETQNRCLTKNVSFVEKMRRILFFNFLNHFLTPFRLKWETLQKTLEKMIQIKFYAKFGQNTTFHVLEKKVEKSHFFSFFETQNRCLTKNASFMEKIRRFFFFYF